MPTETTDRNLLFGVLALQADFLDAAQFAEACSAWAGRKDTLLADLLLERGLLTAEQRGLVDLLLRQKLHKHGGDAHAGLAAVTTPNVRSVLESIADDAVCQSVVRLHEPALPAQPGTVAYEPDARQRYTLTRLHAKGGIGQVWLAHDEDIGRDVALKELRPDRGDSPVATARFLEEAKVTGQLEHPGIVPVYELVQPRKGQPCYAMRFMGGRTLADAIKDFHRRSQAGAVGSLELRQLLTAFVAVCNAVAYAHSRGVLHRDLKPHNVALGDFGEVLVLDWGLAKVLGKPEEPTSLLPVSLGQSDSREETRQGQVLGTPAYMAPEQAEGRLDRMDQRSDVYGLGAVLYQILTGEPPFSGTDAPEILKHVVQEPLVPPRQRVAATPRALQAICLKALAKERGHRYASARELAREVERFLADEPVAAYREPWRVRLGRWARRHRPLVAAAVALLLTATIALTVSTALVRKQELAALQAKEQAERERDRADANFRLAKEAVEQTVTRVAEDARLKQGDFHDLRKSLLSSAVPFYEKFVQQVSDDPELEAERGRAYNRLAQVRKEMGELAASRADYERALAIFTRLAADNPSARDPRIGLGWTDIDLGNVLLNLGDLQGAEDAYRAALKEYQQLAEQDPLAANFRNLLAKARLDLGVALDKQGKRKAAEREYRAAREELLKLVEENPNNADFLFDLAKTHMNLGLALRRFGRWADAEDECHAAMKALGKLATRYPAVSDYRSIKAKCHINLGQLLSGIGQQPAAEAECRAALKELRRLVDEYPAVPDYRHELSWTHSQLGRLLRILGRLVEAETEHRAALEELQQLTVKYPDVPTYRDTLAGSRADLALLLQSNGRWVDAEAELRACLKERQRLVADSPLPEYRQALSHGHNDLGALFFNLGRKEEAEAEFRAGLKQLQRLVDDHPTVPDYRCSLATSQMNLAGNLLVQNRRAASEVEYRASIKETRWLMEHFASTPEYQLLGGACHVSLGELLLPDATRRAEAEAELKQAADILEKLVAAQPKVPRYRAILGTVDYNYACLEALRMKESAAKGAVQEEHAVKAMQWLHKAKEHGAFTQPFYRQDIEKNADLAPLRKRPDFQKLLAELKRPS